MFRLEKGKLWLHQQHCSPLVLFHKSLDLLCAWSCLSFFSASDSYSTSAFSFLFPSFPLPLPSCFYSLPHLLFPSSCQQLLSSTPEPPVSLSSLLHTMFHCFPFPLLSPHQRPIPSTPSLPSSSPLFALLPPLFSARTWHLSSLISSLSLSLSLFLSFPCSLSMTT